MEKVMQDHNKTKYNKIMRNLKKKTITFRLPF